MTKVIFIVLTLALGMRPLELVLLFSASSRAILCRLASVSGTEISDGSEESHDYQEESDILISYSDGLRIIKQQFLVMKLLRPFRTH